ncbi:hypothetical protein WR25_05026 isoform C [Diploscapter pachys]|uniref:Uncharacterized protein n=2 Tax=Diploscapter pachys TaxID=2018661 RepID=A0A2A2J4P1_9BILA|nr:hypothetical protein WR25_05026 isoform C [Diploscapter pachys]
MSIDDVVLILSIPRRLLLRIRFSKNFRNQISSARSAASERPVVVFHRVEERKDSDQSNTSILSNQINTAHTWLGKKARQQQQEMNRVTQSHHHSENPQPSSSRTYDSPRLVNGHSDIPYYGRETPPTISNIPNIHHRNPGGSYSARFSDNDTIDTVSRTARIPPPKIGSASSASAVRRTESFSSAPGVLGHSALYTLPRSSTAVPPTSARDSRDVISNRYDILTHHNPIPTSSASGVDPLLSRSLCSPILPRPLRTTMDNKSNSLPRRRAISGPRNVKWRNDVLQSDVLGEDSDGAVSAPEYASPSYSRLSPFHPGGRTINDIFSAAEYRNWAGPMDPRYSQMMSMGMGPWPRQSRWSHTYGEQPRGPRSTSVPGRSILAQSLANSPVLSRHPMATSLQQDRPSAVLDRYHVSPLMNRRAPLRAAGPGINVDRLTVNSLTGILFVQILEGRGLKIPDKQKGVTEEMYCVLEVDEMHRARTGVSTAEHRYRWRETFHIDVYNATVTHFFVYSWHPQFRHKLCYKGSLKLLEAFIVDQLNGDRMFALNLEPRGQLIVRIGFQDMQTVFRRAVNPRMDGVFGVPLSRLLQRERRDTPIVLTRLIQEIEKRGVDYNGLYILCGSVEKKRMLRDELETNPLGTELGVDSVPDTNVLACLVKDFLRELPEPLIPVQIHAMLVDAQMVALPNDASGNRQLVLRIIDCLPAANKNCLILILDHLTTVLSAPPNNGLTSNRLNTIFAPLLMCCLDSQLSYSISQNLPTMAKKAPFYATRQIGENLNGIRFAEYKTPQNDPHPEIDTHKIVDPIIVPMMDVFEAMQNNARVKAYAQKLQEEEQKYPLSSAKSLWEMLERLQRPSTTTTPQPPLLERLLQPYIEPWQKQLDDFSKNMAGITLMPQSSTTPQPTTTTTVNLFERSLGDITVYSNSHSTSYISFLGKTDFGSIKPIHSKSFDEAIYYRAWCVECPDRELILANVQYEHVLEMLECIHPTYKAVDDQSVHVLLPLAFDYQMEGLLHRCEAFLVNHNLPFLEKVWLADRYKLNRLLILCLREMRPHSKIDLNGSRYYALSDRVKVLLLERLHGAAAPEEIVEPPLDLEAFQRPSDLFFTGTRAKTGRLYYVNPYYVAAWSNVFQEKIHTLSNTEEVFCPCTHEELKAFLMAIHPPQLRINEHNIGPILMAACKMESAGLLKKCATLLLAPHTQLSIFVRLSLLDRCFLHEMIPACLQIVQRPEHLIQMTQQSTYDCLSTRARAFMLDRLTILLQNPGLQPHQCVRCKATSSCTAVTWMCPQCKTYSSDANLLRQTNQILPQGQQGQGVP